MPVEVPVLEEVAPPISRFKDPEREADLAQLVAVRRDPVTMLLSTSRPHGPVVAPALRAGRSTTDVACASVGDPPFDPIRPRGLRSVREMRESLRGARKSAQCARIDRNLRSEET